MTTAPLDQLTYALTKPVRRHDIRAVAEILDAESS